MDNPKHPPGPGPTCPEEQMAEDIERLENKCAELARREWEARQAEDIQRVARYRAEAGESEAYRERDTALAALRECREALSFAGSQFRSMHDSAKSLQSEGGSKASGYDGFRVSSSNGLSKVGDALTTANRALGEGEEG